VTFLGGATDIRLGVKEDYWVKVFSNTVNGTIKNVYTWKDLILILFLLSERKSSIGRKAIMKKRKENYKN
jgi:hypothetical protein